MSQPDHTKTDTEKAREEELIQRCVFKIYELLCINICIFIHYCINA